jgi:hypothetical protein
LGGKDYITNAYNFTGMIYQTRYRHIAVDDTCIDQYNDYDHRGRVMKIRNVLNKSKQIFASKHKLDMPTATELQQEIIKERQMIEQGKSVGD